VAWNGPLGGMVSCLRFWSPHASNFSLAGLAMLVEYGSETSLLLPVIEGLV
jgi:hypothetical protein